MKKLGLITETNALTEEEADEEERVTRMSRERGGEWNSIMSDPRKARRSPSVSMKLPKWRNRAGASGLSISSSGQYLSPTLLSPSSPSIRRDLTIPPRTVMPGMGMRAVSGSHVPHASVSATAWSTSTPPERGGEKRRRASISVVRSVSAGIEKKSASLRNSVQYWFSNAAGGGDNRYQKISPNHHHQT